MNFFIMVSLFLSAALSVFRGIDLALLTDAETGLCIVGSVWLRYGVLKLLIYGYFNSIRSSRKLAKACVVNIEVMWLLSKVQSRAP